MIKKVIKKIRTKRDEGWYKREVGPVGKGTVMVESRKELEEIFKKVGGCMSPGGAAGKLGVSRAYIHQLEREGKIRAFRIWSENLSWDDLPMWARLLVERKGMCIYIPADDIEKVRKEMLEKAEAKIKKLKGKA